MLPRKYVVRTAPPARRDACRGSHWAPGARWKGAVARNGRRSPGRDRGWGRGGRPGWGELAGRLNRYAVPRQRWMRPPIRRGAAGTIGTELGCGHATIESRIASSCVNPPFSRNEPKRPASDRVPAARALRGRPARKSEKGVEVAGSASTRIRSTAGSCRSRAGSDRDRPRAPDYRLRLGLGEIGVTQSENDGCGADFLIRRPRWDSRPLPCTFAALVENTEPRCVVKSAMK